MNWQRRVLVSLPWVALNIAPLNTPYLLSAKTLPENHATDEQVATIGRYAHQSPFATYYLATMDSNWKMATDFMPVEDFHNTDLHRHALKPLGINHQMFGMLGALGDTGYAIAVNRTHLEFNERDRAMLNAMHPHVVTSFFNAAAHTKANNSMAEVRTAMESAPGAYGYFTRDREIAWLQPRAEAWLNEFFSTEPKTLGGVPHSIRELLEKSVQEDYSPQRLERTGDNELLVVCLGVSVLGGWVMRLDRKPKSRPPHFHPLPNLTTRKNEILQWMVEGKRNEEIAIILDISKRTVDGHVYEILQEMKVENRATAIIRAMEYAVAVNHGFAAGR